jgi:GDP-L-fucose synthase
MFFKGKKVLVTGGSGFIGTHFVLALVEQEAQVRVPVHKRPMLVQESAVEPMSADLSRLEDCIRVCEGMDYVIHAAGGVSGAGGTSARKIDLIADNLVLAARVIQAACKAKVKRLLLFSSSAGYPVRDHPVKEEDFWIGDPHPSYFGYGWFRRYVERLGELVHSSTDTKIAIVRPSAVYGRHDDFNPTTSHAIPALILRALAKEDPFIVWGSPEVSRDFLHVTDLVRGALLLLERHPQGKGVNIAYGEAVTISQVVNLVLTLTGHSEAHVEYDLSKPTTIPKRMMDISNASKLLDFQPVVTLREGLRDTIEWYTRNRFALERCSAGAGNLDRSPGG